MRTACQLEGCALRVFCQEVNTEKKVARVPKYPPCYKSQLSTINVTISKPILIVWSATGHASDIGSGYFQKGKKAEALAQWQLDPWYALLLRQHIVD